MTTCILTDSTAQFPIPAFAGRNRVSILPLRIECQDGTDPLSLRAQDLPASALHALPARVSAPGVEAFQEQFLKLGQSCSGVVAILHSRALTRTYQHAVTAAKNLEGQVEVEVIDAQTVATGLGLVVQAAAKAAEDGLTVPGIGELIRSLLPRIYTVLCIPGLSYLHHNGFLGKAQAIVGEHLKFLPIYVIEGQELNPTQKARNRRHIVDLLEEFITEFDTLEHLGLIQGVPPFETETRTLRERLALSFDELNISEHIISPELSLLIGPHSLGMFLLQRED